MSTISSTKKMSRDREGKKERGVASTEIRSMYVRCMFDDAWGWAGRRSSRIFSSKRSERRRRRPGEGLADTEKHRLWSEISKRAKRASNDTHETTPGIRRTISRRRDGRWRGHASK